jgi:predicted CXXCH cytochrome family protein
VKPPRARTRLPASLLVFVVGLSSIMGAAEAQDAKGGVPLPAIPMAKGANCVEDTDFMRRNHMDMLDHQRDETVHRGVRTKQYSLKECLNCHVVQGPDAKPVTSASPQHFCRSCHDYAAVSIDCFQCHASRPETAINRQELSGVFPTTTTVNGTD